MKGNLIAAAIAAMASVALTSMPPDERAALTHHEHERHPDCGPVCESWARVEEEAEQ